MGKPYLDQYRRRDEREHTSLLEHYVGEVGPELALAYAALDDESWPAHSLVPCRYVFVRVGQQFLTRSGRRGVKLAEGTLLDAPRSRPDALAVVLTGEDELHPLVEVLI